MPTRLIREGILTSDAVNSLTPQDEVLYRRLMSIVDDYGRYDARPAVLRSQLFPLQLDRIRESDVVRGLAACEKASLIRCYEVDGKPYLQFEKFGQQIRAKTSKWPDPLADDNGCKQMRARAHLDEDVGVDGDGDEDDTPKPPEGDCRFDEFWKAYPSHQRKVGKPKCRTHWKRKNLDKQAGSIMSGLDRWKNSEEWTKQGGAFICAPHRWLNEERWNLEVVVAKSSKAKSNDWQKLGAEVHADLLREVQAADPSIDHRASNIDTQRAMRKLAKQKGWI